MSKYISARLSSIQRSAVAGAVLLSPAFAFAADGDIDVSSMVTKIGLGVAAVGLLGLAFLGVTVAKKLWNKMG